MTKLLFIRHGQSMANAQKRFAGHYNIPLTELGEKQAQATAEFIVNNYKVDAVYASDLIRAYETGKAVADKLSLPVITHEGMREINAGEWEARTFDDLLENDENFRIWREDISLGQCTGGESAKDVYERIYKTVCEIARENDGKTVVIATHATPIRVIETRISGRPFSHMKNIPWVTNASVSEVDFIDGRLFAVKMVQDTHLAGLMSTLPANV